MSPQAREDIIGLLKSEKTRPETLEAHYGLAAPSKPLQALQRDGLLVHGHGSTEDVYKRPMAEVRTDIVFTAYTRTHKNLNRTAQSGSCEASR